MKITDRLIDFRTETRRRRRNRLIGTPLVYWSNYNSGMGQVLELVNNITIFYLFDSSQSCVRTEIITVQGENHKTINEGQSIF